MLVPARNEEANVGSCVGSLLAQDYPDFEVIVLDDQSTDGTCRVLDELAQDARLRILEGMPLPSGWLVFWQADMYSPSWHPCLASIV